MIDTPQITQTAAQWIAIIHLHIPRDQIRTVMGPGIRELMETLSTQGITPAGSWFTHHLIMKPDIFDFDICVPVITPVDPAGRVQYSHLPAATVARTVYHGGYEGLPAAWSEFNEWIASQGLTAAPDLWESYIAGPDSSPNSATWRTELNRPLIGYAGSCTGNPGAL